jgi:hypothetical protein
MVLLDECQENRRAVARFLEARVRAMEETGAPGRIRTSDPQIRSLVLYPAELRARLEGAT